MNTHFDDTDMLSIPELDENLPGPDDTCYHPLTSFPEAAYALVDLGKPSAVVFFKKKRSYKKTFFFLLRTKVKI